MFRVDVRGSEYMQVDDEDGNGDDNDDDDDISFRLLGYFVAVPGMTNKGKGISLKTETRDCRAIRLWVVTEIDLV